MTKKKPGAKLGRPPNVERNEERLNLMAKLRAKNVGISYSTAANRASDLEAETKLKPTDPAQLRREWKKDRDKDKAKGKVGPDGEWLWSHERDEKALWEHLEQRALTPKLTDGKLKFRR